MGEASRDGDDPLARRFDNPAREVRRWRRGPRHDGVTPDVEISFTDLLGGGVESPSVSYVEILCGKLGRGDRHEHRCRREAS